MDIKIGIWNRDVQNFSGLELAIIGQSAYHLNGVQISASNQAGYLSGIQAGLLNNSGYSKGIQAAVFGNENIRKMDGLQLALLHNEAIDICGGQIAAINKVEEKIQGIQIGLYNYCTEDSACIQIGLINKKEGEHWYSNIIPFLAVR
ncbi:Uncharacterised protein [uncultured archaeon]|nr:Uncharacterised protein [uncultured archaeon]